MNTTHPQAGPVRLSRVFGVRPLPDGPGAADAAIRAAFNERGSSSSIGPVLATLGLFFFTYNLTRRRK